MVGFYMMLYKIKRENKSIQNCKDSKNWCYLGERLYERLKLFLFSLQKTENMYHSKSFIGCKRAYQNTCWNTDMHQNVVGYMNSVCTYNFVKFVIYIFGITWQV